MAVKPEISLLSCQLRYEMMRIAGTIPRATDPKHHNLIIEQIVNNLRTLEESGRFEEIRLYTRTKELLCPKEGESRRPSVVLADKLFGAWTPEEEEHLRYLRERLEALKAK